MRLLQVVPNPYRILDADGNPIAIYPCHRKHAPGEFVGAKVAIEVLNKAESIQIKRKSHGQTRVDTVESRAERSKASFTFSIEPVGVPADGAIGAYYRTGVRDGVLIAADQKTATACRVPFAPVADVLAKAREGAAKEFHGQWGALPAWANEANQPAPAAVK